MAEAMPGGRQGEHYGAEYDYEAESPHLKHRHLNAELIGRVARVLDQLPASGRPPEVLEVGAGDGSVTGRLLALGCDVTGTEMSADSVEAMRARFGAEDRFRAVLDREGTLEPLAGREFDLVLYASVLHHIPDYLGAIRTACAEHLRPGGALVSLQDPLWYPRMPRSAVKLTQACFLSWRVTRGNILRGLRTRARRARHGLSEEAPGDAVEYHVVRSGVDEAAIAGLLEPRFARTEIFSYWSSQGTPQQRLGERLGMVNTFAVFAEGFEPRSGPGAE